MNCCGTNILKQEVKYPRDKSLGCFTSCIITYFSLFSLIPMNLHPLSLIFTAFYHVSLQFFSFCPFSFIFIDIFIDVHWIFIDQLSCIFIDFYWFSLFFSLKMLRILRQPRMPTRNTLRFHRTLRFLHSYCEITPMFSVRGGGDAPDTSKSFAKIFNTI